jgi:hypothetical protein
VRPLRSRTVALAQGAFYVATGLWPLLSMATFELASGPKRDKWLVKTMGAFIAAVGGGLLVGARAGRLTPTRELGVLAAATLAACDVVYVGQGRIAKSYLLDAAVEVGLVGAWLLASPGWGGIAQSPLRQSAGGIGYPW